MEAEVGGMRPQTKRRQGTLEAGRGLWESTACQTRGTHISVLSPQLCCFPKAAIERSTGPEVSSPVGTIPVSQVCPPGGVGGTRLGEARQQTVQATEGSPCVLDAKHLLSLHREK